MASVYLKSSIQFVLENKDLTKAKVRKTECKGSFDF